MKNLNQVERIKIKLNLAKNTDLFCEAGGASFHKYRLDSPIDIKEVEAFEKEHNILLPDGYKVFLTQIGNGGHESVGGNSGAGPIYGIYKLGHKCHFFHVSSGTEYLNKEPFLSSKLTKEEWKRIEEDIDEKLDLDSANGENTEREKLREKLYAGVFRIGSGGCSFYVGLMLSGEETGRIVYLSEDFECFPNFDEAENFLDWYENWLDSIITGEELHINLDRWDTEEYIFASFAKHKKAKNHRLFYILRCARELDSLSPEHIKVLWEDYGLETDQAFKLYVLSILAKFDYENAKKELNKLCVNNTLAFLRILHLYAKDKTSEWQNIIQKLQEETLDLDVKQYIKYVSTNDFSGS